MYFDIAMPLTLLTFTIVVIVLNQKVEEKVKVVFMKKEFRIRDAILLVAAMSLTVSLAVFIPQITIVLMFLFAYSILLFIFTYIFSDFSKFKARLFCAAFLIISFSLATNSILNFKSVYEVLVFAGLFSFACIAFVFEERKSDMKERWYLAVLPPVLFVSLYIFFSRTPLWFPYMLNFYAIIFAILIVLYLGSLFTWKTTLVFVGLITILDVILVLFTGSMESMARRVSSLQLPGLVALPIVPIITTEFGILFNQLYLGDFFFAGLIGIQTMKQFGEKLAVLSTIAMGMSFFLFEVLLLNYEIRGFPGTLMIISGWLPVVLWKFLEKE